MSGFLGAKDEPIERLEDDYLGVANYVNGLCAFIRECDTPMTVSIQGDWGSGKTSIMSMLRRKLGEDVFTVWVNTWQFSQFDLNDSLTVSVMRYLLKKLDCRDTAEMFRKLKGFGKNVVKIMTDAAVGGEAAGKVGELLEGASEDQISQVEELQNRFRSAVGAKLAAERKRRAVIFVDDLDRLQPIEAVELLEAMKLFLECENCVFVLAVDYEIVSLGIRQKLGDKVGEMKGRSFFDKMIQLPFNVPVGQYNIDAFLEKNMKRLGIAADREEVGLFRDLISTSVGFNPRTMKRLFNAYELLAIITGANAVGEDAGLRKRVIFAVMCAQMSYGHLYLDMASSPEIAEDIVFGTEGDRRGKYGDEDPGELLKFLTYFRKAVGAGEKDADRGGARGFEVLKGILQSSAVTTVKESGDDAGTDDWKRETLQAAEDILRSQPEEWDGGRFDSWHSAARSGNRGFSKVSRSYRWDTGKGFECSVTCYLTDNESGGASMDIFVVDPDFNASSDKFKAALGDDPLSKMELGVRPEIAQYSYKYKRIRSFKSGEEGVASEIAGKWREACRILRWI